MNQITASEHRAAAAAAVPPGQYLTFMLGGEAYALGILSIKEIIEHGQLTHVPMMPEFIRGVINLRGAVVPVIDLAVRFGAGATVVARRTCIVIIEVQNDVGAQGNTQDIGILVDAVNEVREIASADIEPTPVFGAAIRTDFIAGMGKIDDKFVVILDPVQVLSVDEMAVLAEATGELAADAQAA
jgi:purine-binding chemotaxis protein CheW